MKLEKKTQKHASRGPSADLARQVVGTPGPPSCLRLVVPDSAPEIFRWSFSKAGYVPKNLTVREV